jgi:hypothetical protein
VVAVNGAGPTGYSPEAQATTPGVNPDPAQYSFETDSQGWMASGSQIAGVATSTTRHFAGKQSLAVNFNGTAAGTSSAYVGNADTTAGATITFHVWIPSGSKVTSLQPLQLGMDRRLGWKSDGQRLEHDHHHGAADRHNTIEGTWHRVYHKRRLVRHLLH